MLVCISQVEQETRAADRWKCNVKSCNDLEKLCWSQWPYKALYEWHKENPIWIRVSSSETFRLYWNNETDTRKYNMESCMREAAIGLSRYEYSRPSWRRWSAFLLKNAKRPSLNPVEGRLLKITTKITLDSGFTGKNIHPDQHYVRPLLNRLDVRGNCYTINLRQYTSWHGSIYCKPNNLRNMETEQCSTYVLPSLWNRPWQCRRI